MRSLFCACRPMTYEQIGCMDAGCYLPLVSIETAEVKGREGIIKWHHVWSKTLEPKRLLTCKVGIFGEQPEIEKVRLQGLWQERVFIIRFSEDVSEISNLLPVNPLWALSRTQDPFSELHKTVTKTRLTGRWRQSEAETKRRLWPLRNHCW